MVFGDVSMTIPKPLVEYGMPKIPAGTDPKTIETANHRVPKLIEDFALLRRLAAKGLKPAAIARKMGMSATTLAMRVKDQEGVQEALEDGWADAQEALVEQLKKHGEKNVVATIFALKQPHLGGWADTYQQTGSTRNYYAITNVILGDDAGKVVMGPGEHEVVERTPENAEEGEFEEVDG